MEENNNQGNSEKNIEDFIKQLIEKYGRYEILLITKLTQGRFDISVKEAKDWVDKVLDNGNQKANDSGIEQKIIIPEPKKSSYINLREQREEKLKKRRKMYFNISFVLIILAPIFILGSMELKSMAIFILGTACFVFGFVMMAITGGKKG